MEDVSLTTMDSMYVTKPAADAENVASYEELRSIFQSALIVLDYDVHAYRNYENAVKKVFPLLTKVSGNTVPVQSIALRLLVSFCQVASYQEIFSFSPSSIRLLVFLKEHWTENLKEYCARLYADDPIESASTALQ